VERGQAATLQSWALALVALSAGLLAFTESLLFVLDGDGLIRLPTSAVAALLVALSLHAFSLGSARVMRLNSAHIVGMGVLILFANSYFDGSWWAFYFTVFGALSITLSLGQSGLLVGRS
jgi:hypothetical protein